MIQTQLTAAKSNRGPRRREKRRRRLRNLILSVQFTFELMLMIQIAPSLSTTATISTPTLSTSTNPIQLEQQLLSSSAQNEIKQDISIHVNDSFILTSIRLNRSKQQLEHIQDDHDEVLSAQSARARTIQDNNIYRAKAPAYVTKEEEAQELDISPMPYNLSSPIREQKRHLEDNEIKLLFRQTRGALAANQLRPKERASSEPESGGEMARKVQLAPTMHLKLQQQSKLAQSKPLSQRDSLARAEASRGAESDKAKSVDAYYEAQKAKELASRVNAELCRNFTIGVQGELGGVFTSPNYPNNYPANLNCTRIIQAPKGYTIKLEFRDQFHIEEAGQDCDNDRIEIRDGRYGYSPILARYCGSKFPPEIKSTNEAILMRFISDFSITHPGFKGVYKFIPQQNTKPSPPNECRFNVARWPANGLTLQEAYSKQELLAEQATSSSSNTNNNNGSQILGDMASLYSGNIKYTDVPPNLINYTREYNVSLECIWNITVMPGWKIYLTFLNYELNKPNDCESNFLEIYENELNEEDQTVKFCGTRTEPQQSKSNVFNIRHHALSSALGSKFEIVYTAFRDKGQEGCDPNREFDCDDGTCIHESLKCDNQVNCKYRYDEASDPGPCTGADPEGYFFEAEHMVAILVIFLALVSGMCASIYFSCAGKIKERRQRELEYHERRSREASMEGQLNQAGKNNSKLASKQPISVQPEANHVNVGQTNDAFIQQQQQQQVVNAKLNNSNKQSSVSGKLKQHSMQQQLSAESMLEPVYNQQAAQQAAYKASLVNSQQQHAANYPAGHAPFLSHLLNSSEQIYNSRSILTSSLNTNSFEHQHQHQHQHQQQPIQFAQQQQRLKNTNKVYDISSLMQQDSSQQMMQQQRSQYGQASNQLLRQQLFQSSLGSHQNQTTESAQTGQSSQYANNERPQLASCEQHQSPAAIAGYGQFQQLAAMDFHATTMPANANLTAKYNAFIRSQQQQQHLQQHQQQQQQHSSRSISTTIPRHQPQSNIILNSPQKNGLGGVSMQQHASQHQSTGSEMAQLKAAHSRVAHQQHFMGAQLNGQLSSSVACCNSLGLGPNVNMANNKVNLYYQQQQQQLHHAETPLLASLTHQQQHHLYDLRAATLAALPRNQQTTMELLNSMSNQEQQSHLETGSNLQMPRSNSAHQLSRNQIQMMRQQQQQSTFIAQQAIYQANKHQQQHPSYSSKSASDATAANPMHQQQGNSQLHMAHSLSYPQHGSQMHPTRSLASGGGESPVLPPPPLPPSQSQPINELHRRQLFKATQSTQDLEDEEEEEEQVVSSEEEQASCLVDELAMSKQHFHPSSFSTDSSEPTIGMLVNQTSGPISSLTRLQNTPLSQKSKAPRANYPPLIRTLVQNGQPRESPPTQQAKLILHQQANPLEPVQVNSSVKQSVEQQPLRDHSSANQQNIPTLIGAQPAHSRPTFRHQQSSAEMTTEEDLDDDEDEDEDEQDCEINLRNLNERRQQQQDDELDDDDDEDDEDDDDLLDDVDQLLERVKRVPREELRMGVAGTSNHISLEQQFEKELEQSAASPISGESAPAPPPPLLESYQKQRLTNNNKQQHIQSRQKF